jgi:mannitol-1-phosphate/altronate dehydrogenase
MTDPNQILQAMADLTTMEYGSLKAEYRPGATNTQLGPYYQHQVWEQGRNHSRRIPAPEAPRLQKAIANRQTCEKLSAQFIALRVQQTRRAWQQDSKKNTSSPKSKSRSKP